MYKLTIGTDIVDAIEVLQYVRFYDGIGVIRCGAKDAPQGIISYDGSQIYHVDGWPEFPDGEYDTVKLQNIGQTEYYSIREALDSGLDIPVEPETPEQETQKTTAQVLREQINLVDSQVKLAARFASI